MNSQITPEDLALFAMQLLTPEEAAQVMQHLETDNAARVELAQIQGDLALYAMTSELQTPSADARERLMRRVAKEKKPVPPPVPVPVPVVAAAPAPAPTAVPAATAAPIHEEPRLIPRGGLLSFEDEPVRRRRRAAPFLAITGWAIAAGIGVFAALQYQERQHLQDSLTAQNAKLTRVQADLTEASKAQAIVQTLTAAGALQAYLHPQGPFAAVSAKGPKPEGHAAYIADTGQLVFTASHLVPLKTDKTYELWIIPIDGDPIPAGTFKPDRQGFATVVLPALPKGVAAKAFGVTVETDGGATTPTPPIVLAGA